jgi:hypothetical protein
VRFDGVVQVSRCVAGLEHGLAWLAEGLPLSSRLLRELQDRLLARGGGADRLPGAFRRSHNWISTKQLKQLSGPSFPTASKAIATLVQPGIARNCPGDYGRPA